MFLFGSVYHRRGLDQIDDRIIIVTLVGYLIKAVLHIAFDLYNTFSRCAQCCVTANMSRSTDIFSMYNGRSLIERQKEKVPRQNLVVYAKH